MTIQIKTGTSRSDTVTNIYAKVSASESRPVAAIWGKTGANESRLLHLGDLSYMSIVTWGTYPFANATGLSRQPIYDYGGGSPWPDMGSTTRWLDPPGARMVHFIFVVTNTSAPYEFSVQVQVEKPGGYPVDGLSNISWQGRGGIGRFNVNTATYASTIADQTVWQMSVVDDDAPPWWPDFGTSTFGMGASFRG